MRKGLQRGLIILFYFFFFFWEAINNRAAGVNHEFQVRLKCQLHRIILIIISYSLVYNFK